MDAEAFMPSVHQSVETCIEELRFQVTEPFNDGFLNFGIGSGMAACQVLLQRSEDMNITQCEVGAVRKVVPLSLWWWTCWTVLHTCFRKIKSCFRGITLAP
ncbi:hypothetical protein AVEN_146978-1 [Araneus ventricosus]|uniref:Uncharacterized protein n=1 Tax=Araneus ventricosus TaxID=182803 RepID=A0A4Y2NCB8_ARAVE|nr:hypothetical protein AVEN_146978-1 [Araneus ventricosus]